MNEKVVF